jgi:hypothetical protein
LYKGTMKIICTIPTRGIILTEVQDALDRELAANDQIPLVIRTHDLPIPLCRNFLIESALKLDWTHILLLDDDVLLPKGGLKELIKLKTDVAIMNYPMKSLGVDKSYGTVVTDKDKSVAWAGLGACLIRREVFEKISQPWFVCTQYSIRRSNNGQIGFFSSQKDGETHSAGEDTYFFLQVRKEGFKMKVAKKIAQHCYIEQLVSHVANARYQSTHKIVKRDHIDCEFV